MGHTPGYGKVWKGMGRYGKVLKGMCPQVRRGMEWYGKVWKRALYPNSVHDPYLRTPPRMHRQCSNNQRAPAQGTDKRAHTHNGKVVACGRPQTPTWLSQFQKALRRYSLAGSPNLAPSTTIATTSHELNDDQHFAE